MSAPKPKDVLPLAQEITRLEAQLAEAKRKWNLLFGQADTPVKSSRAPRENGIAAKVLKYVELMGDAPLSISDVARGTGEEELAVGRALYRLARLQRIANPARGRYAALEKEATPEEITS
jgi:hypothetical protein